MVKQPSTSLAQDRESLPARTDVLTTMLCHQLYVMCMCRLPKDQDCHELWSRMMKKALRERVTRPLDDHNSTIATTDTQTRNSSSALYAMTTSAETASAASHNSSSVYSKNSLPPGIAAALSDLNLPLPGGLVGQRRPAWTSSQHVHLAAGGYDKSSVHGSLSSSSSLHVADSSYLTRRLQPTAGSRQFDLRHHHQVPTTSASHVHAPNH